MVEGAMTREEIEALWKDLRHWRWGVYYCKADPRVIVPKYVKWGGWTVNFARPSAIPVVLLLLAVLAVPIFIVSLRGSSIGVVLLTTVVSTTVMCLLCVYLSSTSRYEAEDPMDS
jgi:hypothetical protein